MNPEALTRYTSNSGYETEHCPGDPSVVAGPARGELGDVQLELVAGVPHDVLLILLPALCNLSRSSAIH
eukprot:10145865-Alexandrium_andersonii.AAC.1